MTEIDKIYDMLHWNQPKEIQNKGIELSLQYKDLGLFIQPVSYRLSKEIWDNCARIISLKSDEELKKYFFPLVEWLRDMNWPGAKIIKERLLRVKDDYLQECLISAIDIAINKKECDWIYNILDLINDPYRKSQASKSARKIEIEQERL